MSASMADFKLAITMLAALPSNRSQYRIRKVAIAGVVELRALATTGCSPAGLIVNRPAYSSRQTTPRSTVKRWHGSSFSYRTAMHGAVRPHDRQSDAPIAISQAVKRKPCKGKIHRTVRAILTGLR
jgi:hypothetical protein